MHFSSVMSLLGIPWIFSTKSLIKILAMIFHSKTCSRQGHGDGVLDGLTLETAFRFLGSFIASTISKCSKVQKSHFQIYSWQVYIGAQRDQLSL